LISEVRVVGSDIDSYLADDGLATQPSVEAT
jgi:hypothetical protein